MINARCLTTMLVMATLSGSGVARAAGSIDAALDEARAARTALRADATKKKLKHNWQNLARRFEQLAAKYPKSDRVPECHYAAAELYRELSQFSQASEDVDAAVSAYKKVLADAPGHTLADDAALALGKLLADRKNDAAAARKVLAPYDGKGDKKSEIAALLKKLGADDKKLTKKEKADDDKPAKDDAKKKDRHLARTVDEAVNARSVNRGAENRARRAPSRGDDDDAAPSTTDRLAKALSPIASAFAKVAPPAGAEAEEPRLAPVPVERRSARVAPPSVRRNEADDDSGPVEPDPDAVLEPSAIPGLGALTERLRDVRVGERPVDEAAAKLHLKQMTKSIPSSELTLAEQLGLKVNRVIIDAGHGGHDTGAIGKGGTREKDVTLAISLKLKSLLEEAGLEVLLTRDDDTYLKLEDRTRYANRHKGDLFISVHCNSAPTNKLRGVETYTLNTSSDRYAIRLAARENAATERGVGDLQMILADLATKANTSESTRLALQVQRSMINGLKAKNPGIRDLGHKEALFFVLLGAKMPAILVETSFLSHPDEEKLLGSEAYQDEVAHAIASGVNDFMSERSKLARLE